MTHIIKDIKDINRLRQIGTVLIEEGLGLLIEKAQISHLFPIHKRIKHKLKRKEE